MIAKQNLRVPNPKDVCDFCGELTLVKDLEKISREDNDINFICPDCQKDREEGIEHDD